MKLFVWDFHGVLEKDNDLAVFEITNSILEQTGHSERLNEKTNREFYGLKWFQYFERLLPDLTTEQHHALQAACFEFCEKNLDVLAKYIKPSDYSVEVLRAINNAGHDQIILSNTRPHDLLWFVSTVGIKEFFPDKKIIGVNAHQKHGAKEDALGEYLKDSNFEDIVIIGDSQSDIDLEKVAGGTTYFYSHPHIELKQRPKAHHIISDLREILNEV